MKNYVFEICFLCESNERSLMLVLDVSEVPSSVGGWQDSVNLKCLGHTIISPVLSVLRSKKLLVIHV